MHRRLPAALATSIPSSNESDKEVYQSELAKQMAVKVNADRAIPSLKSEPKMRKQIGSCCLLPLFFVHF